MMLAIQISRHSKLSSSVCLHHLCSCIDVNSKKLNPEALNMDEVVLQEKMEQPELNHDDVVMQDLETKEKEEELDAQVTYACTKCPKVFGNSDAMSNHLNTVHPFINLSAHQNTVYHIPNHECKVCDRKFTTRSDLTRHLLEHRDESGKYPCTICGHRSGCAGTLRDTF